MLIGSERAAPGVIFGKLAEDRRDLAVGLRVATAGSSLRTDAVGHACADLDNLEICTV